VGVLDEGKVARHDPRRARAAHREDCALVDAALHRNLIQRVNVGDLLTRSAARAPSHPAIVDGERRWTYRQLNEEVNRIAHGLLRRGYGRGDAVGILSRNRAEFLAIYFACAKIGAVAVPANLMWKQGELAYVLGHARVRLVVAEREFLERLAAVREGLPALREIVVLPDPEGGAAGQEVTLDGLVQGMASTEPESLVADRDPISYLYTSGTTAAPKGVVSSHLAIYMGALSVALDTGMSSADRALALLPLFHTSPLNSLCTPAVAAGATIVIHPGFDAERILDLFQRERVTTLLALPLMYRQLRAAQLARPRDVSALRLALYAMAPMPVHELRQLIELFGCDFALIFGQTEMSPVTTVFRPEHQLTHSGAVGTPSTNVQVAIMADDGRLLPPSEIGEIVYRGPQTLTGYLDNETATAAAFRQGWFHSGDVGYFDADGLLWFKDRFKDVIKSGGENVASVEVEQALYDVEPRILEVVAIGLPHAKWGEAVTAVLVPKEGETIDESELLAKVRTVLSPYKCPKAVIAVDRLPKTATNKVQKAELRQRFAAHYRGCPE
jgi:acyl-CoA synthetase (AMP-forming)/AMP-acid ligase II